MPPVCGATRLDPALFTGMGKALIGINGGAGA